MPARLRTAVTNQAQPEDLDQYRRELTGFCYRMLGSVFEAEDAVQETMVRAWRGLDRFEGRAAVRSWLYRIATNVCLDMLRGRQRRARPMDLGPSSRVDAAGGGSTLPEATWILPIPEERVVADDADPAELAASRETIRLAFVTALQYLPARQRAVLILRDVLRWRALEVAELLDTTLASVNSALQRARATLATRDLGEPPPPAGDARQQALLDRYVDAFERFDVARLVRLLHDEAVQSMPPHAMWLRGADEIGRWLLGPGIGCRGSRLVPTRANSGAAFGQYRPDGHGGHRPWALQVVEVSGDQISALHNFLVDPAVGAGGDPAPASRAGGESDLFEAFGLPARLGR